MLYEDCEGAQRFGPSGDHGPLVWPNALEDRLLDVVRVRYEYEGVNGSGTDVSLIPRVWPGLLPWGVRRDWRYEWMRGGIGPMPAYNRRSRSRLAAMCEVKSEDWFLELKVGETTSDSRAPRRLPSITCLC